MRRRVAPTVQHLLRGRSALGKRNSPLRDELRALLAVARAARRVQLHVDTESAKPTDLKEPSEVGYQNCLDDLEELGLSRALSRLDRLTPPRRRKT